LFHIPLPFAGQFQFRLRRLLRLLDEAVKKDHVAIRDAKDYPRYSVAGERTAYFPKAAARGPAQRHSDRPSEFDQPDIVPDYSPISIGQCL
jgi:hypothetical protein